VIGVTLSLAALIVATIISQLQIAMAAQPLPTWSMRVVGSVSKTIENHIHRGNVLLAIDDATGLSYSDSQGILWNLKVAGLVASVSIKGPIPSSFYRPDRHEVKVLVLAGSNGTHVTFIKALDGGTRRSNRHGYN
jgi:hypothetical protein